MLSSFTQLQDEKAVVSWINQFFDLIKGPHCAVDYGAYVSRLRVTQVPNLGHSYSNIQWVLPLPGLVRHWDHPKRVYPF